MGTAIVTGSGGLVGSETARRLVASGFDVVGLDNDMRARFFGPTASTAPTSKHLAEQLGSSFRSVELDIRDADGVEKVIRECAADLELVVHAAAQPSHDWAASDPHTDFTINANGTLNLLEAVRRHRSEATFVFMSTNKVYGDRPNDLPLVETATRFEIATEHPFHAGIDTSMSIDRCLHSLFGASKVAADVLVQEYGRYFSMPTVCFRGGCLTGSAHAGAEQHGFLSYLMRCTVGGTPYRVNGYGGKQVRDNIHGADAVRAFEAFHRNPTIGAVYNLGGGRTNSVSVLEAIAHCERIARRRLNWTLSDVARTGDHRWYISDFRDFKHAYPEFEMRYDLETILREMYADNAEAWTTA